MQIIFASFLTLWTIAFGAVIGSFLNVVIYRLPRRMSLAHPKSRCPHCQSPIRAIDNVPILSWLWLRGRCRACGAAISVRYPLIEGLVAAIVVGLAWTEIVSGNFNLPGSLSENLGTNPLLWRWETTTIARFAYHAYLLIVAVAIGTIAWDGFRPPSSVVIVSLVVGIAVPLFVPEIWPVASGMPRWFPMIPLIPSSNIVLDANALIIAVSGLAGGLLASLLLMPAASGSFDRCGVLFLFSLAGLYLGWPALASYSPVAGGLALIAASAFPRRLSKNRLMAKETFNDPDDRQHPEAAETSSNQCRNIPATTVCALGLVIQVFAWRFLWKGVALPAQGVAERGIEPKVVPVGLLVLALMFSGGAHFAARMRSAPRSNDKNH